MVARRDDEVAFPVAHVISTERIAIVAAAALLALAPLASCSRRASAPHVAAAAPPERQTRRLDHIPKRRAVARVVSPDGESVVWRETRAVGAESREDVLFVSRGGNPARQIARAVNLGGVVWSPDGERIAYSEGAVVHVVGSDGSSDEVIHVGPGGPYPGSCFNLEWDESGWLSFVEIESVRDDDLANPKRISIRVAPRR